MLVTKEVFCLDGEGNYVTEFNCENNVQEKIERKKGGSFRMKPMT